MPPPTLPTRPKPQLGFHSAADSRARLNHRTWSSEIGENLTLVDPTAIGNDEIFDENPSGIAGELILHNGNHGGSGSVAGLRDRFNKMNETPGMNYNTRENLTTKDKDPSSEAVEIPLIPRSSSINDYRVHEAPINNSNSQESSAVKNDEDKNLSSEASLEIPPITRSVSSDAVNKIQNGFVITKTSFLGITGKGKELFQTGLDKASVSVTSAANITVAGVQTGFQKTTKSMKGMRTIKKEAKDEEMDEKMIEDYITTMYDREVYDVYTEVEAEVEAEVTRSETASSENGLKQPSKWQLPDRKKV